MLAIFYLAIYMLIVGMAAGWLAWSFWRGEWTVAPAPEVEVRAGFAEGRAVHELHDEVGMAVGLAGLEEGVEGGRGHRQGHERGDERAVAVAAEIQGQLHAGGGAEAAGPVAVAARRRELPVHLHVARGLAAGLEAQREPHHLRIARVAQDQMGRAAGRGDEPRAGDDLPIRVAQLQRQQVPGRALHRRRGLGALQGPVGLHRHLGRAPPGEEGQEHDGDCAVGLHG